MLLREELPTYKIETKGCQSLSDVECLSLIIGGDEAKSTEKARALLSAMGSLLSLSKMNLTELSQFVAPREAKRIMAAFELSRRKSCEALTDRPKVSSSEDVFRAISGMLVDLGHEEFWIVMLNKANEIICKERLSSGGTSGTVVDIKMVMKRLIEKKASAFIAVHNHPYGSLIPSQADIYMTDNMKQAGKVLDLPLLDHLIVSERGYYSFADQGEI